MAKKQDWYQQVENERLPPNEIYEKNDGTTIRIEYREENDTIYQTTKTFEKRQCTVLPIVAERKKWEKFGEAANDPPGINPTTTKVGDELKMEFTSKMDDDTLVNVVEKILGIRCRRCKGQHLTARCPHKDRLPEIMEDSAQKTSKMTTSTPAMSGLSANKTEGDSSIRKHIPSAKRPGALSNSTNLDTEKQDSTTIRVSNLPEETQEQDLHDLFDRYGKITRIHLPKDQVYNTTKGFAFVTFTEKRNAQIAMDCVNGFGYGNLILQIEWALNKPKN